MRLAYDGRPEYFRFLIENLLHHQWPDGFTPTVVIAESGPWQSWPLFHAQPFLMQGALMYVRQTGDDAWLASAWPRLAKYLAYFEENWSAPHGLFRWPLTFMSGLDNDIVTTSFQPDTVIPADINAWLYLEYLSAAKLASRVGKPDLAAQFRQKAQALRDAINSVLWNEEVGSYSAYNLTAGRSQFSLGDRYVKDIGQFAFQTCSNLHPLYARIADPERARRMIETYVLSDRHFLSPFGIRSLSRSSEFYNNAVWGNGPRFVPHDRLTNSNWQGPVWVPLSYFMFHALIHYGYRREAEDLADRTIKVLAMSLESEGSFAENFDGDTGAPLYARHFASWNILADRMHEELRSGRWIMDPMFDENN
jgi:glycogen debranching enzyme